MKKFPKDLEDVDALDAELVSDGPADEVESGVDSIDDPEPGLQLEEMAGLHVEDGESEEA